MSFQGTYKDLPVVVAKDRDEFRAWLEENGKKEKKVWLKFQKVKSPLPSVRYAEAVEEALCFGWIDSVVNRCDEHSYYQYFTPRTNKSGWSALNRKRVAALIKDGKMTEEGLRHIRLAKENGRWEGPKSNVSSKERNLVVPKDLKKAFKDFPDSEKNFKAFPPSSRKLVLHWIDSCKRDDTRERRIVATASSAEEGLLPKLFRSRQTSKKES